MENSFFNFLGPQDITSHFNSMYVYCWLIGLCIHKSQEKITPRDYVIGIITLWVFICTKDPYPSLSFTSGYLVTDLNILDRLKGIFRVKDGIVKESTTIKKDK